jgi:hypothetical protein
MSILNTPLRKFFTETVIITPWTGDDDFSKPTYGDPCEFLAKIERQERATRTAQGLVIRSRRLIYLFTIDTSITTKDLLMLPVGYEPREPKIIDVRIVSDQKGVHHIILET